MGQANEARSHPVERVLLLENNAHGQVGGSDLVTADLQLNLRNAVLFDVTDPGRIVGIYESCERVHGELFNIGLGSFGRYDVLGEPVPELEKWEDINVFQAVHSDPETQGASRFGITLDPIPNVFA